VIRADTATVTPHASRTDVSFRLGLIVSPSSTLPNYADVRLSLDSGVFQSLASGARVPVERRHDLEVPEQH
jgi:hypothetical protein